MRIFISFILLTFVSAAWADHIPRSVGGVEILFPVPSGFVEATAHDEEMADALRIGLAPGNTFLGGFVTEKDWIDWVNYTAEENMSPYMILQYQSSSQKGVSPRRWKKFKSNVRTVYDNMWEEFSKKYLNSGVIEDAGDALSQVTKLSAEMKIESMVPLETYKDTNTVMSTLWFVSATNIIDGKKYPNTQFQTSSAIYLKDRIIIVFVYMTKKKESDAEFLMELTDQWVEELIRINEEDFDGESKDVSDAALTFLNPQMKQ